MSNFDIHKFKLKDIVLGSIIGIIGKRNTGKSILLKELIYNFKDVRIIIVSLSEKKNKFFSKFCPSAFIYEEYDPDIFTKVLAMQDSFIQKYGKDDKKSQLLLILDDCLCEKKIWKNKQFLEVITNGRHSAITMIFTLQYPIAIENSVRGNLDYIFIFSQECVNDKKRIFDNFVSCFDNIKQFNATLDICTEDYSSLVINRRCNSNLITKKILWFKASLTLPVFVAGSKDQWKHDEKSKLNKIPIHTKNGINIRKIN